MMMLQTGDRSSKTKDELLIKYDVFGYPTIKWFTKGSLELKKYEGARTADALAEFVNTKGGNNVNIAAATSNVVILSPDNFDEVVMDKSKDVLVEFYAPWYGISGFLAVKIFPKNNKEAEDYEGGREQ